MKRIPYILSVLLLTAAVSCEKQTDGTGATGTGNPEIIFPSGNSYMAGEDVIIICDGISPDALFWLEDTSGELIPVDNVTVTASGFFFTVTKAGEYTIVVEQDGTSMELGKISVTVPSIDVTVNTVPRYCIPGQSFTVSGSGFDESAVLAVTDSEGSRFVFDTEASDTDLTASVPDNAPRGKLNLFIVQENGEKTISTSFFVTSEKHPVRFRTAIGTGESAYIREFSFTRDDNGEVTASAPYTLTVTNGADETYGEYLIYDFAASDTEEENGYYPFTLKISSSERRVLSATFETERTDPGTGETSVQTEEFPWEYDPEGYLTWYVGGYSNELVSENGNINFEDFDGSRFYSYDDSSLINNPFGPDCTLALQAASQNDHILSVALALGFTGSRSANLPSGTVSGQVTVPISYTFDAEGYVTVASYGENSLMPVTVEFEYE